MHHAACMTAKQLLRFIIDKLKDDGAQVVHLDPQTKTLLTLNDVAKRLNVTPKTIDLDSLNIQVKYFYNPCYLNI